MKLVGTFIVIAFVSAYIIFLPRLILKHNLQTLKIITFEIVFQNFICILSSAFLNNSVTQLIILYKELVFYCSVFLYFIFHKCKIQSALLPLSLMMLLFIPYFFVGSASLYTKLICFRQLMTPIILVLYGSTYRLDEISIKKYLKFVVILGVAQAIFGFAEEFVFGDQFWISLQIQNYMHAKGFSAWTYNGLPGDFYSADFYYYTGHLTRRMVGLVADPILTGHYLAFCLVILFNGDVFYHHKLNIYVFLLLLVAMILTLSKGAILVFGIAFVIKMFRKNKTIAVLLLFLGVFVITYMVVNNSLQTIAIHLRGLTSSLSINNAFGHGLGMSGNYAGLYGGNSVAAGESYIGTMVGQMGYLGVIIFLYSFVHICNHVIRIQNSKFAFAIFAFIIAVLVESFASESAISFVGSGIAFLSLGLQIGKVNWKTKKYKLQRNNFNVSAVRTTGSELTTDSVQ